MAGNDNKNVIWALPALFTNVTNNLSPATGSSLQIRNAKHNCRPLLSYPRLSSLSLGVGSSQRKQFTWC